MVSPLCHGFCWRLKTCRSAVLDLSGVGKAGARGSPFWTKTRFFTRDHDALGSSGRCVSSRLQRALCETLSPSAPCEMLPHLGFVLYLDALHLVQPWVGWCRLGSPVDQEGRDTTRTGWVPMSRRVICEAGEIGLSSTRKNVFFGSRSRLTDF